MQRYSDPGQVWRLLTMALKREGAAVSMRPQLRASPFRSCATERHGLKREGLNGLPTRKALGRGPSSNDEQRARIAEVVETGLSAGSGGVVHCRPVELRV